MLMHPIRPELDGKDLSGTTGDSHLIPHTRPIAYL